MAAPRFAAGTTIRISAEVTNYDDDLFDPDTSIEVQVEKDGSAVQAYAAMTKDDTGKYYYRWQSLTTMDVGRYETKIKVVHNARTSIEHDESAFHLY